LREYKHDFPRETITLYDTLWNLHKTINSTSNSLKCFEIELVTRFMKKNLSFN